MELQTVLNEETFNIIMAEFKNDIINAQHSIDYYDEILRYDSNKKRLEVVGNQLKFEKKKLKMLEDRLEAFKDNNAEFFI